MGDGSTGEIDGIQDGAVAPAASAATAAVTAGEAATLERVCFLEWRLEQLTSALEDKERLVQQQRVELAEGAERELDAARRLSELERRLADVRREAVALGDRSVCSEVSRSDLERRLHAFGRTTSELTEQRQRALREKQRVESLEQVLEHARERISILEVGRERFFAKLIQWQRMDGTSEQADLAEFIAELRSEISRLSSENASLLEREQSLRRELENVPRLSSGGSGWAPDGTAIDAGAPCGERVEVAAAHGNPWLDGAVSTRFERSRQSCGAGSTERSVHQRSLDEVPVDAEKPEQPKAGPEPRTEPAPSPGSTAASSAEVLPAGVTLQEAREHLQAALGQSPRWPQILRMLQDLFSPAAVARRVSARSLARLAGEHAAPALAAALAAAAAREERIELLDLLAQTSCPLAVASLQRAQRDPDPSVRAAAIYGFVRIGRVDSDRIREALVRALSDPDPSVRRRAILAAGSVTGFDATDLLVPLLRDSDPGLRRAACSALVATPDRHARRALIGLLLDTEIVVRRAAARSLETTFGARMRDLAEAPEVERRRAVRELRSRAAMDGAAENRSPETDRHDSVVRLLDLRPASRRTEPVSGAPRRAPW